MRSMIHLHETGTGCKIKKKKQVFNLVRGSISQTSRYIEILRIINPTKCGNESVMNQNWFVTCCLEVYKKTGYNLNRRIKAGL